MEAEAEAVPPREPSALPGPGPALEVNGCATGQDAVAGFVTALKDIDGVTRVGVESSELGEEEDAGRSASTEIGSDTGLDDGECRTRNVHRQVRDRRRLRRRAGAERRIGGIDRLRRRSNPPKPPSSESSEGE